MHIWNIKATGAHQAFSVSAYPNAPLVDFRFDHIDIQAQQAGSITNAQDWSFSDVHLQTSDGSTVRVADSDSITGLLTRSQGLLAIRP